ncbi:MAG: hypothetical protein IPJ74_11065 [Saprospiraceae bacterium]|nr:hypothetical protein [Saprospiraceae bacterium]
MAGKKLQDYSIDELKSRKKTISAIVYTLGAIILIYAGIVIYIMANGSWKSSNTLLVVPLASLTAIIAPISGILGSISSEIKKREA